MPRTVKNSAAESVPRSQKNVPRPSLLNWFGHVVRRDVTDPLSRIQVVTAPGRRPRGRPKKTWKQTVDEDLRELGLSGDSAMDRDEWRTIVNRLTS